MDDLDNPYRSRETPSSPSTSAAVPSLPPSTKHRKLISELGLQFPPTTREDIEGHQARVALLTKAVAAVPPNFLQTAIAEWIRTKAWMPKASELIQMAHDAMNRSRGTGTKTYADWVRERNYKLQDEGNHNIRWIMDGTGTPGGVGMHLESVSAERPYIPLSQKEIDNLSPSLINIGLKCGAIARHGDGYVLA